MNVGLYLRCSTSKQDLVSQRAAVVAWAERHGYAYELYEDESISGRKTDRPAMRKLIEDAKAEKFKKVGVLELSRVGRSIGQIHKVVDDLSNAGVEIVLTQTGHIIENKTIPGAALLGGLALAADLEWRLIKERNARGRQRIKEEGIKVGRKLLPVSLEAVQALRAQGKSYRKIAEALHTSPATVMRRINANPERKSDTVGSMAE